MIPSIEQQIQDRRNALVAERTKLTTKLSELDTAINQLDALGFREPVKVPASKHRMHKQVTSTLKTHTTIKQSILDAVTSGGKTRTEIGSMVSCKPRSLDSLLYMMKIEGLITAEKNEQGQNVYRKVG